MATTVDWDTGVITVQQADMTFLGGNVYELDVDALRLELKALEASEAGQPFEDTHRHNTEVLLSGVRYVRTLEVINGYTLTISPGTQYQVSCKGANHNLQDVYNNLGGPTLLPNNSAGSIVVETGTSGLTAAESAALLAIEVSVTNIEGNIATIQTDIGLIQADISLIHKILRNRKVTFKSGANVGKMFIYDDAIAIAIASSGGVATVTHTSHGYANGKTVLIQGANETEYNGSHVISNVTANTYDYTLVGTPASPATGFITEEALLLIAQIYEDDAFTIPYQGSGLEAQTRLADAP